MQIFGGGARELQQSWTGRAFASLAAIRLARGTLDKARALAETQGDLNSLRTANTELAAAIAAFRKIECATELLPDGRTIRSVQLEGLREFARRNKLEISEVITRIKLNELGDVVEADFNSMDLTTLQGLSVLTDLQKFRVFCNLRLKSLDGLRVEHMVELNASWCGLSGNLQALNGAHGLRELLIMNNKGLTSLAGLNVASLESFSARDCGLSDCFQDLIGAGKIRHIDISGNQIDEATMPYIESLRDRSCRVYI